MARQRRNTRARRTKRSKRTGDRATNLRLSLGGPRTTASPSITVRETVSFDLQTRTEAIVFNASVVPIAMAVYAIPPRDTSLGSQLTNVLPMITTQLNGTVNGVSIVAGGNNAVLQFNRGPKLVARYNFKKLYTAGMTIPMYTFNSSNYWFPVRVSVLTDQNTPWEGDNISIFVVAVYEQRQQPTTSIYHGPADMSGSPANTVDIDIDYFPSVLVASGSVAGLRTTAMLGYQAHELKEKLSAKPPPSKLPLAQAGAAEAQVYNA